MPVNREPVIFVLDTDVQMLPWESLPRLRRQEVYRMPSMGSIFLTLDRNYQRHKKREREEILSSSSYYPKVDPFDTYYLLNPSGDLKDTEDYLKPWERPELRKRVKSWVWSYRMMTCSFTLAMEVGNNTSPQMTLKSW